MACSAISLRLSIVRLSFTLPDDTFDASTRFSIRCFKLFDFSPSISRYSFACSSSIFLALRSSTKVTIDVSGVLRSCDTFVISSAFVLSFFTAASTADLTRLLFTRMMSFRAFSDSGTFSLPKSALPPSLPEVIILSRFLKYFHEKTTSPTSTIIKNKVPTINKLSSWIIGQFIKKSKFNIIAPHDKIKNLFSTCSGLYFKSAVLSFRFKNDKNFLAFTNSHTVII